MFRWSCLEVSSDVQPGYEFLDFVEAATGDVVPRCDGAIVRDGVHDFGTNLKVLRHVRAIDALQASRETEAGGRRCLGVNAIPLDILGEGPLCPAVLSAEQLL